MEGLTTEQQVQHIQNGINAAREGDIAKATKAHLEAETAGLQATQADKARSDAAALLSQATSAADYDAKLAKIDKAVAAKLPTSNALDFSDKGLADTQERILTSGMNSEQLAAHQDRQASQATRDLAEQSLAASRKANEQFREFMMQGRPGPAQVAAQKTANYAQKTEDPLWRKAGAIAVQLKDGNPLSVTSYVTKDGTEMTMAEHLKGKEGDPQAVADAVADMKSNLQAHQNDLRKAINAKYDALEKGGMPKEGEGAPSTSREEALKSVDDLAGRLAKTGGKAAPAQTAKSAATPEAPAIPKPAKATSAPIGNFPTDLAGAMQVGVPRQIKLKDGSSLTVVKQADGKVYKQ